MLTWLKRAAMKMTTTVTVALIKWEFAFDNAQYFLLSHSMHRALDIVVQGPSWYIEPDLDFHQPLYFNVMYVG